jgi:hypothetical protein
MRNWMSILLVTVMVCGLAVAGDAPKAVDTKEAALPQVVTSDHLNNVVRMDASGNREALCLCGQEFQVTKESPTIIRGEETHYCHNQQCHDMYMSTSAEAQDRMVSDYWKNTFPFDKMATNQFAKDGKTMATCLCGKVVDVNDKTPHLTENGVTMYVCSDACKTALHGMSAEMRMQKEMAVAHTTLPKDASDPAESAE